MGTTLYTCYRRIDFRRGDPKRLGILVPKATGGWPAPQMPTRDRRLQPQSKDNFESHNRQLGRNSLGLNREIGEITHLCMHGQHQTQSALCALRANPPSLILSLHFAGAPPSQPIQRGNPRPRQQPSRTKDQPVMA
jgi:hypothetical protein